MGLVCMAATPAAAAPGDILVADFNAFPDGGGGVIRVDPVTGARTILSANGAPRTGPGFADPAGMALAPGGEVLVADLNAFGGPGGVIRVDPVTGARTTLSENLAPLGGPSFEDPSGIALDGNGDLLITDRSAFGGSSGGVMRVDRETGVRTAVSHNDAPAGGPSFVEPVGIALAPNGDIYVTDEDAFADNSGGVIRVDPVTGARTVVSANGAPAGGPSFVEPVGVLLGPDGDLLVVEEDGFADASGGVIRVDPTTGARTTVSANAAPAGSPSFRQPYGIALASDASLLVADFDAFPGSGGGVIRVDPVSGARRVVSALDEPAGGPSFVDPVGIAVIPGAPVTTPAPPLPPAAGRDTVAPVISAASVRPRVFAVVTRGRPGGRRRAPRGTSFRYVLSEPARVIFTIERKALGRKVGGRCLRPTRGNRGRRRCARYRRVGSFSQQGQARANRRRFGGRIARRSLRPGAYRASVRASDPARNRSRARRLYFRVVD